MVLLSNALIYSTSEVVDHSTYNLLNADTFMCRGILSCAPLFIVLVI